MITWILTAASLLGNFLNCIRVKECFLIWIACNFGWMIYDYKAGVMSRVFLDFVQSCLCVYGFWKWRE